MKAFLLSVASAVAIAVAAWAVLDMRFQQTSAAQFTTAGARIDAPGDNLVDWR